MIEPRDITILVVEDERALNNAITHKLEMNAFKVVSARSVNQAFGYLREGPVIDAVWLDHYLFGPQSGLDLVIKLRNSKSWINLPILLVSNTVSPEKVQTYLKLGIYKYYAKVDNRLETIVGDINTLFVGSAA
jgi:DNA-binding response OmpR family regulator